MHSRHFSISLWKRIKTKFKRAKSPIILSHRENLLTQEAINTLMTVLEMIIAVGHITC